MDRVIVFSQNLKLESLKNLPCVKTDKNIIITTQKLFPYEKNYVQDTLGKTEFLTFADLLNDAELEMCDHEAYSNKQINVFEYWEDVKELKNKLIIKKINQLYQNYTGYILSDDLGIYEPVWIKAGFKRLYCQYYFTYPGYKGKETVRKKLKRIKILHRTLKRAQLRKAEKEEMFDGEVYSARYKNRKIIFIGRMPRIAYRLNLDFSEDPKEKENIKNGRFLLKSDAQYISTLHESGKCCVPDDQNYEVFYIQDGYLPSNYSNYYLKFKPSNVKYYCWDTIGKMLFDNHKLPVEIMPYRKKLELPKPVFNSCIKKVLVATSGSGDWTALKNRSDDDLMLETFVKVARQLPTIQFVYRCHPTWVHPEHVGVNSIKRAIEYVSRSGLSNIKVSSNIPSENLESFTLSFSRSSLDDDMNGCDFVFGEHSVSMIDAGFKNIPFASVNITKRRDLFESMTELGFPHCTSTEEIVEIIEKYNDEDFRKQYGLAIDNYNKMTARD